MDGKKRAMMGKSARMIHVKREKRVGGVRKRGRRRCKADRNKGDEKRGQKRWREERKRKLQA